MIFDFFGIFFCVSVLIFYEKKEDWVVGVLVQINQTNCTRKKNEGLQDIYVNVIRSIPKNIPPFSALNVAKKISIRILRLVVWPNG